MGLAVLFDQLFNSDIPGKLFGGDHMIRIPYPLIALKDRFDDLSLGCRWNEFHIASDHFRDRGDIGREKRFFHCYAFGMHGTESFRQRWCDDHIRACDQSAELVLFETVENLNRRTEVIFPYLFFDILGPFGIYQVKYEEQLRIHGDQFRQGTD